MPSPGRNDYCPCGSGRKYKKCCGRDGPAPDPNEVAGRLHELDRALVERISRFGKVHFHPEFRAVLDASPDPKLQRQPYAQLVLPLVAYVAPFGDGTLLDRFLAREAASLDPRERDWLDANRRAWLSVWEILSIDPERSMRIRDLLTGEERTIIERMGTRGMRPRLGLLARVVDSGGISLMVGSHPRVLEPGHVDLLVQSARRLLGVRTALVGPDRLQGPMAMSLVYLWEELVKAADSRPLPTLVNMDGDTLVRTTERFGFAARDRVSIEQRLSILGGFERMCPEGTDPGEPMLFNVVAPNKPAHGSWEKSSLGTVEVEPTKLVITTNSEKRADALRERVEAACTGLVVREGRDQIDVQDQLASSIGRKPKARASGSGISPEIEAVLILEMKAKHYAAWRDTPIPALGSLTPKEAMTNVATRRKLDVLLKDIEAHEALQPVDRRFDVRTLRRQLGLPAD